METTRQKKIAGVLQQDLGEIIDGVVRDHMRGALLSVSEVRVSPDLANAKVFVSVFPVQKKAEAMQLLEHQTATIRHQLGTRIRHQMRIVPELLFRLDETLESSEQMDRLLNEKGELPEL